MLVVAWRSRQLLGGVALVCLILAASAGPLSSQSPFTKGHAGEGVRMGAYDPYGTFANDAKISIEHIFIPWQDVNLASLDAADKYARANCSSPLSPGLGLATANPRAPLNSTPVSWREIMIG